MNRIREYLLRRSNLDRGIIVRAVEGAIVGSVAFLIGRHLTQAVEGPSVIIGAIWSAIARLVVLETGRRDILRFSARQALGTFLGALISALYLLALPPSIWGLALCTFLTALACYTVRIPAQARLASATAVVILGVSVLSRQSAPLMNAELRFVESLIGLTLAVAVSFGVAWGKRLLTSIHRTLLQ